jgi:hypothetical protein
MKRTSAGPAAVPAPVADRPAAGAASGGGGPSWLRRAYHLAALIDGVAAVGMAFPSQLWPADFLEPFDRDRPEFAYGTRVGAPIMAGWSLLLVWAGRVPVRRRGVLPLSCAVLAGLAANDTVAIHAGRVTPTSLLPTRVLQAGTCCLLGAAYVGARAAAAEGRADT